MMRLILSILVGCWMIFPSYAEEIVRNYKVSLSNESMPAIASQFEVVKKDRDGYEVYVSASFEQQFLKLAPDARLLERDIHAYVKSLEASKSSLLAQYHSYPQVEETLRAWTQKYPSLASLETYGKTGQGRSLYALRLTSNVNASKPELMITAATHGDELITVEVLLNLVDELLAGYGTNERLTKMIDDHIIYILPVTSPDGFSARRRYVNGADPNRVFPWPENLNNKPIDCISAWMAFADAHKIAGSVDMHAYGKLAMFPWGYTETAPNAADEADMKTMVEKMAHENNYTSGQISTTIYVAKGNSADYFYWKNKTRAIAVELSTEKIPDPKKIPGIVTEAREMMWQFIEHF